MKRQHIFLNRYERVAYVKNATRRSGRRWLSQAVPRRRRHPTRWLPCPLVEVVEEGPTRRQKAPQCAPQHKIRNQERIRIIFSSRVGGFSYMYGTPLPCGRCSKVCRQNESPTGPKAKHAKRRGTSAIGTLAPMHAPESYVGG